MANYPLQLGLNLRLEYIDDLLLTKPPLACLEVIAENFFSPGAHHAKLEKLRADYEITLHCLGMNIGGIDPLDLGYLHHIDTLRKKFAPRHISDHLSVERHAGICFHDLLPFPFHADSLRNVTARVTQVQDFLQEKILLENLSYYVEFTDSDVSEVAFINNIIRTTGAQLLLDLNNLWVNEQNLGHSAAAFLTELDWTAVAQVHLAGAETIDNVQVDTHGAEVPPPVLQLLHEHKHKLAATTPIIYERDRHLPSWPTMLANINHLQQQLHA